MNYIGLLCNCSLDESPRTQLSPSLVNRAYLIDRILREDGAALFLCSPRDVQSVESVPGYEIDGEQMKSATRPLPSVNANWTYGTRRLINQGIGYKRFKRLLRDSGISVYVPYEFSELVSNKLKTCEVVGRYDGSLHPRTEDYLGSSGQVESFLERSDIIFLKPRAGNKGNQIFVLKKSEAGLSLKYYEAGAQRVFSPITVETALDIVAVSASKKNYVVQHGVESLRHEGSVFDVRVVMVHDGDDWHSILETRLAPEGSDLSNIFQGGSIEVTEDLLITVVGASRARVVEDEIRGVSLGLARHLETLFPDSLMEMGFDFVLDREARVHLVEVNAKPGIAGFGSEAKFFDWKREDQPYYERWVYPHVRHLAGFLRSRLEADSGSIIER